MDQEIILGEGESFESQNPIEESELQLRKSTRKRDLSSPKKDEWLKAKKKELESMKTNKVWDLVGLPQGCRSIGNKWILTVKRKLDGSIEGVTPRIPDRAECRFQKM
ncbi:hypothetical protein KY284_010682 [Solanum tuberosum]|nr:hypothetical protein KY284_010682 [Solanum tuberosum]